MRNGQLSMKAAEAQLNGENQSAENRRLEK
jgi:hypothetical protein